MFKDMDEDLKKYIYWIVVGLLSVFAVYTFVRSYMYDSEKNNMLIPIEKSAGNFKILKFSGPKPFVVDLVDLATDTTLHDVFITANCPQYQKNQIGMVLKMVKVVNVKASTGEKVYSFEEGYDTLCTNKKPKE